MRTTPQILRLALYFLLLCDLVDLGRLREDNGYCLENNCKMDTEPLEDGVSQPTVTSVREHQGEEIDSPEGMPPAGEDDCGVSKVHSVDGLKQEEGLSIRDKVGDNDEDEMQPRVASIVPEGVSGTTPVGVLAASTEVVLEPPTGEDHISQDVEMKEDKAASCEDTPVESDHSQEPEAMEAEPLGFPGTLEGFQYKFDDEGRLRHTETNEAFVYEVRKGDSRYNQARYEALGEVLNVEVYRLLETRCKLIKHYLPVDASEDEARSFFFMSERAMENPEKLLILIHGSGVVRAGQWARSLIINNDLDSGTQLPYIERGLKEGYGVMVLNTNNKYAEAGGRMQPIRGVLYIDLKRGPGRPWKVVMVLPLAAVDTLALTPILIFKLFY